MNNAKWENWTNLALGIWLLFTPRFFTNSLATDVTMRMNLNFWIVGAAIAVSAGLALRNLKPWEEWANLILGGWMIISPWVFGYTIERGLLWNSLLIGAVVATLSGIAIPIAQKLQHQK